MGQIICPTSEVLPGERQAPRRLVFESGFPHIKAMARKAKTTQFQTSFMKAQKPRPSQRPCDWQGCQEHGEHRAPKSRHSLNDYHWFCMDHIREHNKQWNFFEGMSEDEVECEKRKYSTWDRPTWKLGENGNVGVKMPHNGRTNTVHDDFDVFEDATKGSSSKATPKVKAKPEEIALNTLGLDYPITAKEVKARYKTLAKRHHPDANDGDKAAEERFKKITEAYRTVMDTLRQGA